MCIYLLHTPPLIRILEELVDTSYRKGGANASIRNDVVIKRTVKNKIHALQFIEQKGDIHKSVNSTIMPKLVYVYEVVDAEDDRRKLVNCIYLGGVYEGPEEIVNTHNIRLSDFFGEPLGVFCKNGTAFVLLYYTTPSMAVHISKNAPMP